MLTVLNTQLEALLEGHRVASEAQGEALLVQPSGSSARLEAQRSGPNCLLFRIQATGQDGTRLEDLWAGMGQEDSAAIRDGLNAFVLGGFHVFLAALWGVLEPEQVDHVALQSGPRLWDLYLGPATGRSSPDGALPLPELWTPFLEAVTSALATRERSTIGRLYVSHLNQEMTFEALLDGEPHAGMQRFVSRLAWTPSPKGFASQRLLWIAVPRRGDTPAHAHTRPCPG